MATATGKKGARASRANGPIDRSRISVPGNRGTKVVRACTIRKPAGELYAFWRDFTNLTQVIKTPVSITSSGEGRSHWSVPKPMGKGFLEWDAEIINEHPDQLIAWRTLPGSEVAHAGSVRFEPAPGDEGTEVTVQIEYDAPGGKLAGMLAKLSPEGPKVQIDEALRRFKALMEAGEIPTTEGQPVGEPQRSKRK
jgi:uncharacterized membrane protein